MFLMFILMMFFVFLLLLFLLLFFLNEAAGDAVAFGVDFGGPAKLRVLPAGVPQKKSGRLLSLPVSDASSSESCSSKRHSSAAIGSGLYNLGGEGKGEGVEDEEGLETPEAVVASALSAASSASTL